MNRRGLLVAGGAWLVAAASRSFAQMPKAIKRIAFVHPGIEAVDGRNFLAFRNTLKELGYVEGQDISIGARWAEGNTELLASLAAEAVKLDPAVILTATSAGVAACMKATSSIPIVFATAGNPVERGFVSSLSRPGGNVTGIIVHSGLVAKLVEITREAMPATRRLAILLHDKDPIYKEVLENFEQSALRFKFESVAVRFSRANEIERAFDELAKRKAEALIVTNMSLVNSLRQQLVERSRRARLPLFSTSPSFAEIGGLLGYGTSTTENYRRAAALVDKILRGTKPGELAVEQPERFELVVNMKTAKAIDAKLSPITMLRATKVIE